MRLPTLGDILPGAAGSEDVFSAGGLGGPVPAALIAWRRLSPKQCEYKDNPALAATFPDCGTGVSPVFSVERRGIHGQDGRATAAERL
jgi:hypothetical protein